MGIMPGLTMARPDAARADARPLGLRLGERGADNGGTGAGCGAPELFVPVRSQVRFLRALAVDVIDTESESRLELDCAERSAGKDWVGVTEVGELVVGVITNSGGIWVGDSTRARWLASVTARACCAAGSLRSWVREEDGDRERGMVGTLMTRSRRLPVDEDGVSVRFAGGFHACVCPGIGVGIPSS